MNTVINNSLKSSMSYQEYRDLVKSLTLEKSTTGNQKSDDLINYTKLNERRMKRWDKSLKVSEEFQTKIQEFDIPVTWLIITESWCGDAAHVLPALNKIAELNSNIKIKVVLRDENPELMDMFLTNGGRSVPKLIMIDNKSGEVINTYGPRPSEAASYVSRFKAKYGELTPDFKEDLQHWYNNNKGQNVIEDIIEMLRHLEPNVCL